MIQFNTFYFCASEFESVESRTNTSDYPYSLTVNLKSGKSFSMAYKDENARNIQRRQLVRDIERELRAESERIENRLYRIEDCVRRLDKRQLRIWQQLRDLLHIPAESEKV